VLFDRINMRCDRPDDLTVGVGALREGCSAHGGLLKWELQCTPASKLCLVQRAPLAQISRQATPGMLLARTPAHSCNLGIGSVMEISP
jgi:hypothetical protein